MRGLVRHERHVVRRFTGAQKDVAPLRERARTEPLRLGRYVRSLVHTHATQRDAHSRFEPAKRRGREWRPRRARVERFAFTLETQERLVLFDDALALDGHAHLALLVPVACALATVRAPLAASALYRNALAVVVDTGAVVLESLDVVPREARDRTQRTRLESRDARWRHARRTLCHVVGHALRLSLPRVIDAVEPHRRLGSEGVDRGERRCRAARLGAVDSANSRRMLGCAA